VDLPTASERRRIATIFFRSVPGDLNRDSAADLVARATAGRSGADIRALVERVKLEALAGAMSARGRARVGDAAVRRTVARFARTNGQPTAAAEPATAP
jgi:SpoVK/Ycf46/Vps4 family AAA+-type ATPase